MDQDGQRPAGGGGLSGLFGGSRYGYTDPSLNVPVTSNPSLAPLSPYLNFDPNYIGSTEPEYIFPDAEKTTRGRFEHAFGHIGGSCMVGAMVGGARGWYTGLRDTNLAGLTGKIRRTQLINYVTKQGASAANSLGVLALMYGATGSILALLRGSDDELNTVVAGTTAGLLYKSTAGAKACMKGGAIGFGLATAYALWTAQDKIREAMR